MPNIEDYTYKEEKLIKKEFDHTQIYMAEVMETTNVDKDGSIMVWILNSGSPTKDRKYWTKAYYCSPFYGTTTFNPKTINTYGNSPTSFGWWMPMPYVGNYVFLFFPRINGSNVKPYWFGCPMDKDFNSMLPGMFNEFNNEENAKVLSEINAEPFNPLDMALAIQGLRKDKLRGITTSSSKRETPSMCYGFLSPLGHQMVIDDGWSDEDKEENLSFKADSKVDKNVHHDKKYWSSDLDVTAQRRYDSGFRFRTRNGSQILISDCGDIYAINGQGNAWVEITPNGELNGWAEKNVNIACDGDINLHSRQNVNIDCDGKISLRAKESISVETPILNVKAAQSQMNSSIVCNDIEAKSGNIGSLTSQSAQIIGTFSGTLDGTSTYATSAGKVAIRQPKANVQNPDVVSYNVTEENEVDGQNGTKIKSICTQVPTHEPWDGHNYNDKIKSPTVRGK